MGGRADGRTGRVALIVALSLPVCPSARLSAQGVLNQFSYDNLRLSGLQVDAGILGASELTGTTVGGVRVDYGRIAPRVRLLLGLSYFKSQFDQKSRTRFEQRLDSIIIDPSGDDTVRVGRIQLSDLIGDIDFQLVFPQGHGINAYIGTGISVHARNGSGPAINGTFVDDALDVITAGLNGTLGFEFNLSPAWRFTVDGRGMLSSGLKTASLRTGIMYRFRGGREPRAGSRTTK
ncbi:MAG TPA: hypothetical protein VL549_06560 [Gemmatimonadales bacterium]|jgi:hypothetical protein|nr:hypothetical protein [Gemmatimonadales bacterium]